MRNNCNMVNRGHSGIVHGGVNGNSSGGADEGDVR